MPTSPVMAGGRERANAGTVSTPASELGRPHDVATFGYADPPYLGQSKRHYGKHKDYAGEVDHAALIKRLCANYDGWALSLSEKSLPVILPLCPGGIVIGAWFKPIAPPLGDHFRYSWEPILVSPVRRYGPGYVPHALIESPPMFTFRAKPAAHVIGEKPEAFAHWVFALAGLTRDDEMTDLFPGSGAVGRAWETYRPGPTVGDGYAGRNLSVVQGSLFEDAS